MQQTKHILRTETKSIMLNEVKLRKMSKEHYKKNHNIFSEFSAFH